MLHFRKLVLMGLAALMVCAVTASAGSAATITSPQGTLYTGPITATTEAGQGGTLGSTGPLGNVSCNHSHISGHVLNASTGTGNITSASWSGCTSSATGGSCNVTATTTPWHTTITGAASPYTFNVSSPHVDIVCGAAQCTYTATTVPGSISNPVGTTAGHIKFTNAPLSGGFCGSGTWNATYTVRTAAGALVYID